MVSEPAVRVQGLRFRYAGSTGPALTEIRLEVPAGQLCAVVGPNCAGKSTLCRVLAGFVPQFFAGDVVGEVRVAGHDVLAMPPAELAGEVGLVFQNPFNQITGVQYTVTGEVAFGLENLGLPREEIVARTAEALAATGLAGEAERSPYELSGGQQQRLALASIIAMRPKVLVLDEPTAQLDPRGTRELFETLRRLTADRAVTVVLTEHKLEWLAAYADRVVVLEDGRIVADGSPREVLASERVAVCGVGRPRYTSVVAEARARGLLQAPDPLPVTLEQAVDVLRPLVRRP
jgi:energy-coupling factor transporter ATP-binding protein EcfA2